MGEGLCSDPGIEEREMNMEMYDKVSRPSERCRMCEHERLQYYKFPCKDCMDNGGSENMFVAKGTYEPVCTIKDSGERRVFETGAVRDITEDKGRCDLLPLDVVADITAYDIMRDLDNFQNTGKYQSLIEALFAFRDIRFDGSAETMLLEVSKHFANGANKYEENNWRKGIPVKSYVDSAARHYLKYERGDEDEPHDLAFVWNLLCAIWTCKHKPELNDYAKKDGE